MLTTNEEINEARKLQSNDGNTVENVRVELREATLTKRKQNRTSAWDKNRKNLGECPGNELFTVEYVNERVKFLKKKRISPEDYRYLPNALIQVCMYMFQKLIFFKLFNILYTYKIT